MATTYSCSTNTHVVVSWLEPLAAGLRRPRALCNLGADIVDRGYLLLSFKPGTLPQFRDSCSGRRCQAIYIDLGASTWDTGTGGPSQSWFVDAFTGVMV